MKCGIRDVCSAILFCCIFVYILACMSMLCGMVLLDVVCRLPCGVGTIEHDAAVLSQQNNPLPPYFTTHTHIYIQTGAHAADDEQEARGLPQRDRAALLLHERRRNLLQAHRCRYISLCIIR